MKKVSRRAFLAAALAVVLVLGTALFTFSWLANGST